MTKKLPAHEKNTRKPISRACTFCHRKHLQCDPGRPCKNCTKRGVADQCENVERKRAKYLSEAEKLEKERKHKSSSLASATSSSILPDDSESDSATPMAITRESMFPDLATVTAFRTPLKTLDSHPSTAPNLSPRVNTLHEHHHQHQHQHQHQHHIHTAHKIIQQAHQLATNTVESPDVFSSLFANQEYSQLADLLDNNSAKSPSQSSVTYNTEFQTAFQSDNNTRPFISLSDNSTPGIIEPNIMMDASSGPDYTSPLILRHLIKCPEEVYTSNLQPYNYPKAYHALLDYLRRRFDKIQLMQIAETMAAYRPSFIAATRSLVELDLLFAERSFQRSLLEYESMSSLSSSPTIMWRRTGEVVAVSTEFSSLTSHTKTELLSKRTFIIELMDDPSALDYFRLFSSVAFGDLHGVIITECTLQSPMGEPIRCASTWTVKRDVFDIPMLIVGQFLPILQVK